MFQFSKFYFLAALLFFVIEVLIAFYVKDAFIRPYGGDFLVIFFLYCLLKSFLKIPVKNAIFGVLLFAFVIEGLQYIKLVDRLGLEDNQIATIVLGNHFEWLDMLFYSMGALAVVLVELAKSKFLRK